MSALSRPDPIVAYDRPGGEGGGAVPRQPIDLEHLSRQTMGDRALQEEILGLFLQQATMVQARLRLATQGERLRLCHGLKGSARSVGAFPLADALEAAERHPSDHHRTQALLDRIAQLRAYLAASAR